MLKVTLSVLVALLLAALCLTWWALESGGVAIIETSAEDGSIRSTHVWYVEPGGELWLEAGTPENGWFVDIGRRSSVEFVVGSKSRAYVASPVAESSGHERIRAYMREKYGVRDWWVASLFDTSRSIAVRLLAADERVGE